MTFSDTLKAIKHYWKICVIVPLVFALCCGGFMLMNQSKAPSYQATVSIIPNSIQKAVLGICKTQADVLRESNPGYSLSITAESTSTAVNITVRGANSEKCTALANELASQTKDIVTSMGYPSKENDYQSSFDAYVTEPSVVAEGASTVKQISYLLIAIILGLIVALFIVLLVIAIKRPVISEREIEEMSGYGMLQNEIQNDEGASLATEIIYTSRRSSVNSVFLFPVSDFGIVSSKGYCELLRKAFEKISLEISSPNSAGENARGINVIDGGTIGSTTESMIQAHDSDAVVFIIRPWKDRLDSVESSLKQLQLIDANVIGFVFA